MKTCPECGAQNDVGAAFCFACGHPLPAVVTGRMCHQCGYAGNQSSARYCASCGAELRGGGVPRWLKVTGSLLLVSGLIGGGLIVALHTDMLSLLANTFTEPTQTIEAPTLEELNATEPLATLTDAPEITDTPGPVEVGNTPRPINAPEIPLPSKRAPTSTPPPSEDSPTPAPASIPALRWEDLGTSVEGRALPVAIVGYEDGTPVVLVGSIQGDQANTRDLLNALVLDLQSDMSVIPPGVALHIIPSINPDGNADGTRRNANNVDINRNWDTYDWRRNAEQPGGVVNGSGGPHPHSEPETRCLADYLLTLKQAHTDTQVIVWHNTQRLRSGGLIYPAIDADGIHDDSLSFARRYADSTGYAIEQNWEPYTTSGELIAWSSEEDISAIDVVIPHSISGADRALRGLTLEALIHAVR